MTSLMLLMLAAIVLLSFKIFETEESLSSPCKFFDVSNSSMLSLFRLTVDFIFKKMENIISIRTLHRYQQISEKYVYLQNDKKYLVTLILVLLHFMS